MRFFLRAFQIHSGERRFSAPVSHETNVLMRWYAVFCPGDSLPQPTVHHILLPVADVEMPECERSDPVFEEIALLFEGPELTLLGI